MSSVIYTSCLNDGMRSLINFERDAFRVMLCGSGYRPDKTAHTKRSDVTDEVSGTGYTPGGLDVDVDVRKGKNVVDIELGRAAWPAATIRARFAVYYKSRGGAAANDELVAAIDFGLDVASTNGEFTLTASTMRFQN